MSIDVSVIVVSYQTVDLIGPCLASVLRQRGVTTEVFVVDNASTDGSAAMVAAGFPTVHLTANEENRGFGAANNQALPRCRGRHILFLNPDTVLEEGALAAAVAYMDERPELGLAGLHILNPDGTDQESVSTRYLGHRYATEELRDLPGDIAAVLGAAMIAPREAIEAVGGFDEDFFLYGEDEDLCLRLRRRGLRIGYIPGARVLHHHGQSERRSTPAEVWRKKFRAEWLFYRKHYRPETIARIRRAEFIKARWRILTLNLELLFADNKRQVEDKLNKYRALAEELRTGEP
ncbi:MAG: glycosyltransferase family 2 protein [Pseudomonadota bacterium]|nr:glycosyltransferase family 2 protein [Pseudomonadota bacterium]